MEPTKEQLQEWWDDKEAAWQKAFALAGPSYPAGKTGFCIRGGRGGAFCLHLDDHGAGLFGENVIATTWGGYMHVECAVQTLRELEQAGHTYVEPIAILGPQEPVDHFEINRPSEPVDFSDMSDEPQPIKLETNEDDPSGFKIEGAGIEEVLTNGTQAELIAMVNQFAGQPLFVLARRIDRSRLGRPVHRYFAWKVVE